MSERRSPKLSVNNYIHFSLLCLFGVNRPTRELFTHMYMIMTGEGEQIWAVRFLYRTTPTVIRGIGLKWSSPRTRDTHFAERLAVELSLPAFRTVAAGIRTPKLPLAGPMLSNPSRLCRGLHSLLADQDNRFKFITWSRNPDELNKRKKKHIS